jgi:o-succinylbenzoate synthase
MTPLAEGAAPSTEAALRSMRIRAIRWRPFRLPMRHHFEAAHGALDDREGVLLQLEIDGGATGLGEASPLPSIGGGTVADVLVLLERHADALLRGDMPAEVLANGPGAAALRCALDVALLDLEAQRAGCRLAQLLAPDAAEAVTVNAVIGGGPPEEVVAYGREATSHGYRVVKLKVGVDHSVEGDIARVRALRMACPDAVIRLDANGAWSEAEAAEAIRGFYPLRVELLEQPVAADDVEALARVRANAPLRIAADEALRDPALATQVIDTRAVDMLVLKPMVLGGLRPALDLAARAAAHGVGAFVTTTFDSSVATAAAAHLAAALPTDAAHGLATVEHLGADLVSTSMSPHDGWLKVPDGPGLGVELDEDAVEAATEVPWVERRA